MLTFTRNPGQSVRFGELGEIQLSILHVSPGQVKMALRHQSLFLFVGQSCPANQKNQKKKCILKINGNFLATLGFAKNVRF